MTSLRKLFVYASDLTGLHPHGVLACSVLEDLQLSNNFIASNGPEEHVDLTRESVEAAMSLLSKLTTLSRLHLEMIVSDRNGDFMVDLGTLHTLSVLQDLTVSSDSGLCLPVELSTLQNLTSLRLTGFDWDGEVNCGPYADLVVDWSGMFALRSLTLEDLDLHCTSNIVKLTALRSLFAVRFKKSGPVQGSNNFKHMSMLMYRLAKYCPHVGIAIY